MPRKPGQQNTGLHAAGIERPHVWKCGPDPYKHSMYIPFLKIRAQAKYRGEEFDLEFEDFFQLWNGFWEQRGRDRDALVMTRIEWQDPWHKDNITLITRTEQCQKQALYKRALGGYKRHRGMDIQQRTRKTKNG